MGDKILNIGMPKEVTFDMGIKFNKYYPPQRTEHSCFTWDPSLIIECTKGADNLYIKI